jgi:hypothetical protein
VRSEQVRERLTSRGWRDFHDGKAINQTEATLKARRPNGRLFELKLDRCSGEIVAYRALEPRPLGPYAYRQPYGPYGDGRWGPQAAPNGYSGPNGPYDERRPNGYDDNGYGYNGYGYSGPYAYGGPNPYGYGPPRWLGR